ncbi:MAG: hypothetical protein KDB27_06060, partial [Planctomycetales bacterium]|nr:hypothetical protein [Planctomycetales bacterium]
MNDGEISGAGEFHLFGDAQLVNAGNIIANKSGERFLVQSQEGHISNNGTMSAESGGILLLNPVVIDNVEGSIVAKDNSAFEMRGGSIRGGLFASEENSFFGIPTWGGGSLEGEITNAAHFSISQRGTLLVSDDLALQGSGAIELHPNSA